MQCEGNQAMLYSQHILGVIIDTSWHKVRKYRQGSIFSYRGGSCAAAQRRGQLMAILGRPAHGGLAGHVCDLKPGTVWAEEKGG